MRDLNVQVSHYLAPEIDEQSILGDYKIEIYSQKGLATGEFFSDFKVFKTSNRI